MKIIIKQWKHLKEIEENLSFIGSRGEEHDDLYHYRETMTLKMSILWSKYQKIPLVRWMKEGRWIYQLWKLP